MYASRACDLSFGAGEIFHLHELANDPAVSPHLQGPPAFDPPRAGHSVRVLGFLARIDLLRGTASLAMRGAFLTVDCSLLPPGCAALREGCLCQVLGEIVEAEEEEEEEEGGCLAPKGKKSLRLVARIVCDAEGLDVDLWEQALAVRRRFLLEDRRVL